MKQPRLPQSNSPRIVVDCLETKGKLILIGDKTGETIKEIIVRLVNEENKKQLQEESE